MVVVEYCQDIVEVLREPIVLTFVLAAIISVGMIICLGIIYNERKPALQENTAYLNATVDGLSKTTENLGLAIAALAEAIDSLDVEKIDEKTLADLDASTKKLEESINKLHQKEK